jgi:hypothetical protein
MTNFTAVVYYIYLYNRMFQFSLECAFNPSQNCCRKPWAVLTMMNVGCRIEASIIYGEMKSITHNLERGGRLILSIRLAYVDLRE